MAEAPKQASPDAYLRLGLVILRPFVREWRGRKTGEILAEPVSSAPLRAAVYGVAGLILAVGLLMLSITTPDARTASVLGLIAVGVVFGSLTAWFVAFFAVKAELRASTIATQKAHEELAGTVVFQNVEALQKQREQVEDSLFERNLKDTFYLQSLSWEGTSLFENGSYQFAPRVNVLLGKNGYGKTLLFRTLAGLIQRDAVVSTQLLASGEGRLRLEVTRNGSLETIVRTSRAFEDSVSKIPLLAIPDSRFVNRSVRTIAVSPTDVQAFYRSSASHFLTQQPYESVVAKLLDQMVIDYSYGAGGAGLRLANRGLPAAAFPAD